jgi:glycopeptide antibiotics resistance protein
MVTMRVLPILVMALAATFLLPPRRRCAFWTFVILIATVPWGSLQDHTHWSRVGWWPYLSPPVRFRDIVGNMGLYVPWGWFFAQSSAATSSPWTPLMWALALSLGAESSQLFSHSRFPSLTDTANNVVGAGLGVLLWHRIHDGKLRIIL